MSKTRVVVKGGGKNLYFISESNGTYFVYQSDGGNRQIGKTRSKSDAITLIRSHSGKEIQSMN